MSYFSVNDDNKELWVCDFRDPMAADVPKFGRDRGCAMIVVRKSGEVCCVALSVNMTKAMACQSLSIGEKMNLEGMPPKELNGLVLSQMHVYHSNPNKSLYMMHVLGKIRHSHQGCVYERTLLNLDLRNAMAMTR